MADPVPNPEDLPKLPVITVTGKRRESHPPPDIGTFAPGTGFARGDFIAGAGFVGPATAPIIEEIIVAAKRRPPPPPTMQPPLVARAFGWIGLAAGGIYLLSRAAEKAKAEQDAAIAKLNRDRELRELAEEMSFDINVRAKRLPDPQPYVLPPLPVIIPKNPPPPHLVPIWQPARRVTPTTQPLVAPDVEIAPVPPPTVPLVQPTPTRPAVLPELLPDAAPIEMPVPRTVPKRRTRTEPSRRVRPETQPQTAPVTAPAPAAQPAAAAAVQASASMTQALSQAVNAQTRRLTQRQTQALSSGFAGIESQVEQETRECKEDQPRDRCYKKLIREHQFPQFDDVYEWSEIDCFTGEEI